MLIWIYTFILKSTEMLILLKPTNMSAASSNSFLPEVGVSQLVFSKNNIFCYNLERMKILAILFIIILNVIYGLRDGDLKVFKNFFKEIFSNSSKQNKVLILPSDFHINVLDFQNSKDNVTLGSRWKQLEGLSFNPILNTTISLKHEIDFRITLSKIF